MVGNKAQKAVAAALTGMMVLGTAAPAFAGQKVSEKWYRLDGTYTNTYKHDAVIDAITGTSTVDGKDRYDTMLDAVLYNGEMGTKWGVAKDNKLTDVVLVSGTSYADALAASALAGTFGSPIITTPANTLGVQAVKALKYVAKNNNDAKIKINVWIVGGTTAVDDAVKDAVDALSFSEYENVSFKARRVAGANRQETSIKVLEQIGMLNGSNATPASTKYSSTGKKVIFVANGTAWADALSTSSFAYEKQYPLILTNSDGSLTAKQEEVLTAQIGDGAEVCVVGGPAEAAYDTLSSITKHEGYIYYIKGDDRYDTSARLINNFAYDNGIESIAVATGENWPDALVGGPFIGQNGGALVLADEDSLDAVDAALDNSKGTTLNYILGGKSAVSEDLEWYLANVWFK